VVVAKNENQTCLEAINQNMSLINKKDIITTQINYPSEAQSLEQNKEYCWRVAAYSNNMEYSRSEEWVFAYNNNKKNIIIPNIEEINNKHINLTKDDNIIFRIDNQENKREIIIVIEKLNNQIIKEIKLDVPYGQSIINLTEQIILDKGEYYINIKNLNNKKYQWRLILE
jgi:hypothetical protein